MRVAIQNISTISHPRNIYRGHRFIHVSMVLYYEEIFFLFSFLVSNYTECRYWRKGFRALNTLTLDL